MEKQDYEIAVEWDIPTWRRAVEYWEEEVTANDLNVRYGLELGSRHGGLSYFFAKKFKSKLICSDYNGPSEQAKSLHHRTGTASQIQYAKIDATSIDFPDNTFDFIIFKSMLGAIGSKNNFQNMEKALAEMHRTLKPGGVLFFAENLKGSQLHQFARSKFVKWGNRWHYLSLEEMTNLLSIFSRAEIKTTGFTSAFCKTPQAINALLSHIDTTLTFLPPRYNYVSFGHAIK